MYTLMKRMYQEDEVKLRIAAIPSSTCDEGNEDDVSYTQAFTDPAIRGSAWIGFNLAML